jgi:hypothetical protein
MAAMAVVLSAPLGQAEVTTIEPVADTSLFEWLHNYNFGAQDDLPAGGLGGLAGDERLARALFKFDIAAALPAGAQIVEAKLRLEMTKAPEDSPRTSDFALYRVLVDWGEGNKSGETHGGAIATAGEATWEYRFSDNVAWSVGGGQFGVDFADEQSALMPGVAGVGDYIFDFNATGVADVQAALDDPGTNGPALGLAGGACGVAAGTRGHMGDARPGPGDHLVRGGSGFRGSDRPGRRAGRLFLPAADQWRPAQLGSGRNADPLERWRVELRSSVCRVGAVPAG